MSSNDMSGSGGSQGFPNSNSNAWANGSSGGGGRGGGRGISHIIYKERAKSPHLVAIIIGKYSLDPKDDNN